MIVENFGIKNGDFIKLVIFVGFVFFFIRAMRLMIVSIKNSQSRKELKQMFLFAEILIWGIIGLWIYFMIPHGKLKMFAILLIFNGLNFWFWLKIRENLAGFYLRKFYNLQENSNLKIEKKDYLINKLRQEKIELKDNDAKIISFYYTKLLKKGITVPYKDEMLFQKSENNIFRNFNEFYATLLENQFINTKTNVKLLEETSQYIRFQIYSYNKDDLALLQNYIREIVTLDISSTNKKAVL